MDPSNPDDLALLVVQQFLKERNYTNALQETERAHGLSFVDDKLPRGSMLLSMVYDKLAHEAAEQCDDAEVKLRADEEALMQGGDNDFPSHPLARISGLHAANVTSICHCPGRDLFITGAGNGTVQAVSFNRQELWQTRLACGGAIALALHPGYRQGDGRLLVGSMDGSVSMLDSSIGAVLQTARVHAKYVVRVLWAPDGASFVTASWDGNVHVFAAPGVPSAAGRPESWAEGPHFSRIDSLPFATAVQDVAFVPSGTELVIALRDTNYLRRRKFPDIQQAQESINMNALGDEHVSFSARQLDVSPDGKHLLVSTDSPRILLLRIQGWTQLRTQIFGLPMDKFHSSVAVWHSSGYYVMAAAAAGYVYIFHVGTGKVVADFKAHEQNVRWLDYDAERNLLMTCSFDRTVRIYEAEKKKQSQLGE